MICIQSYLKALYMDNSQSGVQQYNTNKVRNVYRVVQTKLDKDINQTIGKSFKHYSGNEWTINYWII